MTELVLWSLLFVAEGKMHGSAFGSAERCRAVVEALSEIPDVTAMSECVPITVRPVAPTPKTAPPQSL